MTDPAMIGIVAEWNPFHNGHAGMIHTIKHTYPHSSIVAVMSGSFVQRGEPALFDKWSRASWACRHGVDVVFELPVLSVLQSADRFAEAGARLLASFGCRAIAFSTESLNKKELEEAVSFSRSDEYHSTFKASLKTGHSYAQASYDAMEKHSPSLARELTKPNNLLGYRYLETILSYGLKMDIIVCHRDMKHNISASLIRKNILLHHDTTDLPCDEYAEVMGLLDEGNYTDYKRYEDACHLISRLYSLHKLSSSGLFKEGLENKWFRESQCNTYSEMLDSIKSKRYLYSRLRRIGACLLLTNEIPSPFAERNFPFYARLLAMKKEKSSLLKGIKQNDIPVITSIARGLKSLPAPLVKQLEMDISASDIRACCIDSEKKRSGREDFYHSPVIIS